jgi:GntR family transcriptional regulator, galactonate operon transcriptional repressor
MRAVDADLSFHRALLGATNNEPLTKMEVFMEPSLACAERAMQRLLGKARKDLSEVRGE